MMTEDLPRGRRKDACMSTLVVSAEYHKPDSLWEEPCQTGQPKTTVGGWDH